MFLKGVVVVPALTAPPPAGDLPVLQRVANRPLVCHTIDSLRAAGCDQVAVVAGPAVIQSVIDSIVEDGSHDPGITYLSTGKSECLLQALRIAAPFVDEDPCIVQFADGLLGQPLIRMRDSFSDQSPDLLLLIHHGSDGSQRLTSGLEKLLGVAALNGSESPLSLAGVCLFGPGALGRAVVAAPPADEHQLDLIAIAEQLAAGEAVVEASVVQTWRRYCGDPRDLLELNRIVLDQLPAQGDARDRGENRIEGRAVIHPTAQVSDSIIVGPTIIGPRARVSHSYIGPYTSIGADAEIEGAEIVRSIVAEGARILHIDERIEGSTIGRRAHVLRDFGLPRALRLHVGESVHVALN